VLSAMDNHGSSRFLSRSPYTSSYAHMGEVYVYHDLFGYILKMSPDLLEFLNAFEGQAKVEEVCKSFATAFGEATPETFIGTFIQFGCLITPNYDQIRDIWEMIPVKGRWNIWSRGEDGALTIYAAWGDRPVERHALTVEETAIWDAFDGENTLEHFGEKFGKEQVAALVKRMVHHGVQALKLSAMPMAFYKHRQHQRPPYLMSTLPYASYDPRTDTLPPPPEDYFSPEGYYEAEVEDADAQFDHEETTLSHLFRRPHPALRNRTYGEALVDGLSKRWTLPEGPIKILEVGGGLGWVARAVTEAFQARGNAVTYHIMELSPALAAAQRTNTAGLPVEVFEGNALEADFPASDYDLVISNEMVGDLTALKVTHAQLGLGGEEIDDEAFERGIASLGAAGELIQRHRVPIGDAPDPFYLNVGAWQLVERLWDVMKPGGHAVITEFGELGRYPILSTQLDHPELSTHFGHLTIVARSIGFEPKFEYIIDLISINREMQGLATTRSYFRALKAALADRGVELEKIGYTKPMFQHLLGEGTRINRDIGTIEFDLIENRLMGLIPHEFKALLLRKPDA